ncbi:MAG: triose-phosphate isomerase [Actinobacteria bacterium]|nr:triose-phosphate isomerase [Actinomycetota bacterium]
MRTPVLAGNWKLFKTGSEGAEFVAALGRRLGRIQGVDVVVAPSFTALYQVAQVAVEHGIGVASQDVYWEEQGAFTGEVAPRMIKDTGAGWVIIGHSERRQFFGETNDGVARKVRAVLHAKLRPILCVGELEEQRVAGETEQVLKTQVEAGLSMVEATNMSSLALAYEPVWAIGTGRTATPQQAQEACAFIRELVVEKLGTNAAATVRILYGGSVKPDNAAELMSQDDIDGGLVGGASLEVESFAGIIEQSRATRT